MFRTIRDIDEYFLSFMPGPENIGEVRSARLKRMEALLFILNSPERTYKSIHIAGSKGKGTTATILARGLSAHFRTGLYRSPHVYDFRERFTLSGTFFSDDEYIRAAEELASGISSLSFTPTTFELYTAFAYILFRNASCSYAVIETGLGGRLDATNTIESIMEILLPIEMEHTEILGDTIEKISREKSKIIKKDSIVIVSDVHPDAYRIFKSEADSLNCNFLSFKETIRDFSHIETPERSQTRFTIGENTYTIGTRIRSREIGKNFALSFLSLSSLGLLDDKAIKNMEDATIEGRFEVRSDEDKTIVLDVAHTPESMRNLIRTFNSLYEAKRTTVLFSCIEGKDQSALLDILLSNFESIVITRSGLFKPSNPDALYKEALKKKEKKTKVYLIKDELEAFIFSKSISDIILITGSFYLVGMFGEQDA